MSFSKETKPEKREDHPIERYPKQDNSAAKEGGGGEAWKVGYTEHCEKQTEKVNVLVG